MALIQAGGLEHLAAWARLRPSLGLNGRQRLFVGISTGKVNITVGKLMAQQYIRQMISRLAERAGLDKRCHPHGLRHT